MEQKDEVVEIIESFSVALKDYVLATTPNLKTNVGFRERLSAHRVFEDELEFAILDLEKLNPLDNRRNVLIRHFKLMQEQNQKVLNALDEVYSVESVKKFDKEITAFMNLVNELAMELKG